MSTSRKYFSATRYQATKVEALDWSICKLMPFSLCVQDNYFPEKTVRNSKNGQDIWLSDKNLPYLSENCPANCHSDNLKIIFLINF